jgi:hypothetical protein
MEECSHTVRGTLTSAVINIMVIINVIHGMSLLEYLDKFEYIFKTIAGYESGDQEGTVSLT